MSEHILQTTATECGLACIATIANHYGRALSLNELRERFAISLHGTTLDDLMNMCAMLHLGTRPLKLELEEITALQTPCILHWDLNHFVVLLKTSRSGIQIHDPAIGKRQISWENASEHFTGIALELTPSSAFQRERPKPPISLGTLLGKVVGWKRSVLQMILLASGLQVFGLISPFLMQWIVDHAIVSGDVDLLWVLIIGFVLLMLVQQCVSAGRSMAGIALSNQLNIQWSSRVMGHLIRLPMNWFERRHIGDIQSRFQSLQVIQQTLTTGMVEALLDGVFAVLTLVIMFMYSTFLSVVVVVSVLVYAIIRIVSFVPLRQASGDQLVLAAKEQSYFLESLRGAQSIKLAGLEEKRRAKWANLLVAAANRQVATDKMQVGFVFANGTIFGIQGAIVLGWGAYIVINSTSPDPTLAVADMMSVGMLMAFLSYKEQFASRMQSFIDRAIDFYMLKLQIERLADIVVAKQEVVMGVVPLGVDPFPLQGTKGLSIELIDVGFRYAERGPWVLRNLNMKIEAGEHVSVVGPSGCGKSTLVKILLGLIEPVEGKVLVNGIELRKLGLSNWRTQLGSVLQDDQIFSGSLHENIAGFDDRLDMEKVISAAKKAGVHDEIASMPMGYHTPNGDMGSTLSGGQKQRVLLARALYRMPRVLVLDEATSHLDVARERMVSRAIAALEVTRIVIAHRPETIAMADRVIDLVPEPLS